jgi:hypothetical protein
MALSTELIDEIKAVMDKYILKIRPKEEIRHEVDTNYRIDGQSVYLFEIRPIWNNPSEKQECFIAKTTFVKTENKWKIFWFKSDMKWHGYEPKPFVKSVSEFVKVIEKDQYGCFWG